MSPLLAAWYRLPARVRFVIYSITVCALAYGLGFWTRRAIDP